MINAVVGAKGNMARILLIPQLCQLGEVNLVDIDDDTKAWKKIWESDVIWLSIPRDQVDGVLKNVRLRPDQLIIDICSIKRRVSEQLKNTGACYLSLHPLHGPDIQLCGQRWVVINTKTAENNENAQKIISFLGEQGINLIQCETEDEHDFMMGIVVSIPEMLTIVMNSLISQYAKRCGKRKPDAMELSKWSTPVFEFFFTAYLRKVTSSAPWLRKDLLLGSFGNLIDVSKQAFEALSKMSVQDIEEILTRQKSVAEGIPPEQMEKMNKRIDELYTKSTLEIFHPTP